MDISDWPVFPTTQEQYADGFGGLDHRDYIAIHSLITLDDAVAALTAQGVKPEGPNGGYTILQAMKTRAMMRYIDANAMLAEREKGTEHED